MRDGFTHPWRSTTGRTRSFRRCCWRPWRAAAASLRLRPNPALPIWSAPEFWRAPGSALQRAKKIRPWRHARGFAQMPSKFQPLNRTPKTHPETHGRPAPVQRGASVLGFCAWFTDTADCDRRSACGWLMLTLVQESRSTNAALWFFSATRLIHTLTSTRILPPPLESLSSIFISLFSSA